VAEAFWVATAPPLAAGAAFSLLPELMLQPAPVFSARAPRAYTVHLGLWVLLFWLSMVLVQRPCFVAVLSVADALLLNLLETI
jgi:hypothetical protein